MKLTCPNNYSSYTSSFTVVGGKHTITMKYAQSNNQFLHWSSGSDCHKTSTSEISSLNMVNHEGQFVNYNALIPLSNDEFEPILSYKMMSKCTIISNGRKCYRCPNCHRVYSLTTTLYNHLSYCGKPRRFKCEYCSYSAKLKQHLFQHLKRIHNLVKRSRFDQTLVKQADIA